MTFPSIFCAICPLWDDVQPHEAPELPCIFGIEQVWGLGPVGLNFDLVGLLLQILGELHRVFRIDFGWGPCPVVVGWSHFLRFVGSYAWAYPWESLFWESEPCASGGCSETGGWGKVAEQVEITITIDCLQLRDPDLVANKLNHSSFCSTNWCHVAIAPQAHSWTISSLLCSSGHGRSVFFWNALESTLEDFSCWRGWFQSINSCTILCHIVRSSVRWHRSWSLGSRPQLCRHLMRVSMTFEDQFFFKWICSHIFGSVLCIMRIFWFFFEVVNGSFFWSVNLWNSLVPRRHEDTFRLRQLIGAGQIWQAEATWRERSQRLKGNVNLSRDCDAKISLRSQNWSNNLFFVFNEPKRKKECRNLGVLFVYFILSNW